MAASTRQRSRVPPALVQAQPFADAARSPSDSPTRPTTSDPSRPGGCSSKRRPSTRAEPNNYGGAVITKRRGAPTRQGGVAPKKSPPIRRPGGPRPPTPNPPPPPRFPPPPRPPPP